MDLTSSQGLLVGSELDGLWIKNLEVGAEGNCFPSHAAHNLTLSRGSLRDLMQPTGAC